MQNYKNMVASNWMESAQKTQRKTIDRARQRITKTRAEAEAEEKAKTITKAKDVWKQRE